MPFRQLYAVWGLGLSPNLLLDSAGFGSYDEHVLPLVVCMDAVKHHHKDYNDLMKRTVFG